MNCYIISNYTLSVITFLIIFYPTNPKIKNIIKRKQSRIYQTMLDKGDILVIVLFI